MGKPKLTKEEKYKNKEEKLLNSLNLRREFVDYVICYYDGLSMPIDREYRLSTLIRWCKGFRNPSGFDFRTHVYFMNTYNYVLKYVPKGAVFENGVIWDETSINNHNEYLQSLYDKNKKIITDDDKKFDNSLLKMTTDHMVGSTNGSFAGVRYHKLFNKITDEDKHISDDDLKKLDLKGKYGDIIDFRRFVNSTVSIPSIVNNDIKNFQKPYGDIIGLTDWDTKFIDRGLIYWLNTETKQWTTIDKFKNHWDNDNISIITKMKEIEKNGDFYIPVNKIIV